MQQTLSERDLAQEDGILVVVLFYMYYREAEKHALQFIVSTTVKSNVAIHSIYGKVNDLTLCEPGEFQAYSTKSFLGFHQSIRPGALFNAIATGSVAYLILEAVTGSHLVGEFPMCRPSLSGRSGPSIAGAVDALVAQDCSVFTGLHTS